MKENTWEVLYHIIYLFNLSIIFTFSLVGIMIITYYLTNTIIFGFLLSSLTMVYYGAIFYEHLLCNKLIKQIKNKK